ncbi:SPFH domain-containing protein [Patulibacter americanus]|uniref:SPFH domain-containing protein n=1 Tax=Patulibacter americanus TaxID=588672 RepID=UPI0003B523DD|nr:flotillin family protein [Patulibacter americanus]
MPPVAAVPTFAIPLAALAVIVLLLVVLAFAVYQVPKGNEALIITGAGSKGDNRPRVDDPNAPVVENTMNFKVVTSGGSIVLPVLQRAQRLSLESRTVDLGEHGRGLHCVSQQAIPVEVEAVMAFKVGNDRASIANAVTRFQDTPDEVIKQTIKDIAHGHLRTVVGGLTVESLIKDRNALTDEVRDATAVEMQKLGLVIDSFQVKDIRDPQGEPEGYIRNLGKPQAARIAAEARIAAAEREQEAAQREAEASAKVAEAQRDADVRRAAAKAETDRAQQEAAQAGPLAEAEARQAVVEADTRAAELEANLEEQRLQTTVRKPADAKAYEQVTNANATREAAIAAAQGDAQRTRLEAEAKAEATRLDASARAEATQKLGVADADATKARLLAEAQGTREKGLAEAAGIEARQRALAENAEGVVAQQIAEQLPAIVTAAARQYDNVENLTVLDGAEGLHRGLLSTMGLAGAVMPLARGLFDGTRDGDRAATGTAAAATAASATPVTDGAAPTTA